MDIKSKLEALAAKQPKAQTITPTFTVKDGILTIAIPVAEMIDKAQPSSGGKTDGFMLDLKHTFQYDFPGVGKLNVRTSSGQMGSAWMAISVSPVAQ